MSIGFVTGATDGIGLHTARKLAASGSFHTLLIHGRDAARLLKAKERIETGSGVRVETFQADFSDLAQVKSMCEKILDRYSDTGIGPIVNNAGVFSKEACVTGDGFELTYQVNVLASHIVSGMLHPIAKGKIIHVASISASSSVDLDAYRTGSILTRPYSAHRTYSDSKLLNVMQACAYAERLRGKVVVQSLDPGTVNTKMLAAGWGMCGIPVSSADNQFSLAMRGGDTGEYFVGDRPARYPSAQCTDEQSLASLCQMLMEHTAVAAPI